MPRCPLCSERSAKRFCPAKAETICSVCCGTKREIEIDCPGSCPHLQAGRSFAESKPPDYEMISKAKDFDQRFVQEYGPVVDMLSRALAQERLTAPWLVDNEAIDVLKALEKTMKTLDSGIYYESVPEGSVRASLFRSLKGALDSLMNPASGEPQRLLKVSEAQRVIGFMLWTAASTSNGRPKCRRYLDWLSEATNTHTPPPESSRLILP